MNDRLSENKINGQGFESLLTALAANHVVAEIDLDRNDIWDHENDVPSGASLMRAVLLAITLNYRATRGPSEKFRLSVQRNYFHVRHISMLLSFLCSPLSQPLALPEDEEIYPTIASWSSQWETLVHGYALLTLDLRHCNLGLDEAVALAACGDRNCHISTLLLGSNKFGPEGCQVEPPSLHRSLSYPFYPSVQALCSWVGSSPVLSTLDLSDNNLGCGAEYEDSWVYCMDSICLLFRSICASRSLRFVDLSRNSLFGVTSEYTLIQFDHRVLDCLAVAIDENRISGGCLESLNLRHNKLPGCEDSVLLQSCQGSISNLLSKVAAHPLLHTLCDINKDDTVAEFRNHTLTLPWLWIIHHEIRTHNNIRHLKLAHNPLLLDAGAKYLADMILSNCSLRSIQTNHCGFTANGDAIIEDALRCSFDRKILMINFLRSVYVLQGAPARVILQFLWGTEYIIPKFKEWL